MMLFYHVPVNICVLYAVPTFIVLFVLSYGVSCFLMHYGVYVEDLAYIVSILLNMMMYFTGVFYSIENRVPAPFGKLLNTINPMACLVTIMRNALIYRKGSCAPYLLVWFLISLAIATAGTHLIYKNENSYVKVI